MFSCGNEVSILLPFMSKKKLDIILHSEDMVICSLQIDLCSEFISLFLNVKHDFYVKIYSESELSFLRQFF